MFDYAEHEDYLSSSELERGNNDDISGSVLNVDNNFNNDDNNINNDDGKFNRYIRFTFNLLSNDMSTTTRLYPFPFYHCQTHLTALFISHPHANTGGNSGHLDINAPALSSMLGGRFIPRQGGNSSTGSRMNLTSAGYDGTPSKEVFVENWVHYPIYQDRVDRQVQRLQLLFQPGRFNVEKGMVKIDIYDHAHCRGVYLSVYYYD